MRHLHFSVYQQYATRISVCVIAVSKSQEFLLQVRRLYFFSTTTPTPSRRHVVIFSTTPDTTAPRRPSQSTLFALDHIILSMVMRSWKCTIRRDLWLVQRLLSAMNAAARPDDLQCIRRRDTWPSAASSILLLDQAVPGQKKTTK